MPTASITKHNILDRLSFVVFGGDLAKHARNMKNALNEFRAHPGMGELVSHPVVQNWCEKGQHPSKPESFAFIKAFLEKTVQVEHLPTNRKTAYRQIVAHCEGKLLNAARTGTSVRPTATAGHAVSMTEYDLPPLDQDMVGTYLTYRMRFIDRSKKPIAQELLNIYSESGGIRFSHWFRRDEKTIEKFEGNVSLVGNMIWLLGMTPTFPMRLRVMQFRYLRNDAAAHRRIRWGLMLSDIPEPTDEPASCRVLIEKEEITIADDASMQPFVIFCDADDLGARNRRGVIRFIENNTTAFSTPGTYSPASDSDHKPVVDELLTVDQRTLDAFTSALYPDAVVTG